MAAVVSAVAFPFVCYGFYRTPYVTREGLYLAQPVPFSHKHHVAGLGIDCRYCHNAVENHAYAGMPATQVCMTCHSQVWTRAGVLAPVRESYLTGRPLMWNRVYKLPDFVFFNHGIHLHAGVACYTCHGRVDQMPMMRKVHPMTMQWCTACHRHPELRIGYRAHVFAMPPPRPADQKSLGLQLIKDYHIHVHQLINCTMCHR